MYSDDIDQDSESDKDSSEDENEDLDTTTNETKETAVSTLGRTRSGVQFAPTDESIEEESEGNKKVDREMKRLSTFFNPEASKAVEKLEVVQTDELERDGTSIAIDHLFGVLGFFCRASFIKEADTALYSDTTEYAKVKSKISKLHILDRLDFINDEKMEMKEDIRSGLLRECVHELKGMLPTSYNEAWNHPDGKFRERWRIGIKKELKSLVEVRKVWRVVKLSSIPKGRRLVKSKWIFDIKRSGLFKVRLVACGYTQIPGVDFTESYAPVINDVSWRILIIAMIVQKLEAKIIDVSTAFLYGDLDENIYMFCKEVHDDDEVLLLLHAIYGLVQAARSLFEIQRKT